jgi:hypothetical protein
MGNFSRPAALGVDTLLLDRDTMFVAVSPLVETNIFLTALVAVVLVLTTGVNPGNDRGL